MKDWGTKALGNDTILGILGGYAPPETKIQQMQKAFKSTGCYGDYEVAALISDTFGESNYTGTLGVVEHMRDSMASGSLPQNYYKITDKDWAAASVCTIAPAERLRLLVKALELLDRTVKSTELPVEFRLIVRDVYATCKVAVERVKEKKIRPLVIEKYALKDFYVKIQGIKTADTRSCKASVIEVHRRGQKIVGYTIVKEVGASKDRVVGMDSNQIKALVRRGELTLTNYTLTSDNKLVAKNRG